MDEKSFLECGVLVDAGDKRCIVGWGKRTWKKTGDISFYAPDFFLETEEPWFTHEHTAIYRFDELLALLKPNAFQCSIKWTNAAKSTFNTAFNSFRSGPLQKVVPYVFEEAKHQMESPILLNSLCSLLTYAQTHAVHPYGFWDKNNGMLGATPEFLFKLSGNDLTTVAVAGTCPIGEADSMLHDSKLLHEHHLVVQGIKESISQYGNFHVGTTQVQKYTKHCHLITPLALELSKNISLEEIIPLLHPTPALGAYPREEGRLWLEEYNQLIPRERFGAPFGFINKNESSCLVAIRNIQWNNQKIKLGAGCGIVHASESETEWNEILLKIKSIKDILAV